MTDLASIKTRLKAKLRELTARAAEIDDDLSQLGDDDWEEQATESAADSVLVKVGDVTLDEIRQVKYAIAQLDAGTYGVCTKCSGSIAKERLAVLPYATKCVRCSRPPTATGRDGPPNSS